MDKVSGGSVPDFAGTIITAGEELVTVFVKAAVGEGKYMALGLFDEGELLFLFVFYFFY